MACGQGLALEFCPQSFLKIGPAKGRTASGNEPALSIQNIFLSRVARSLSLVEVLTEFLLATQQSLRGGLLLRGRRRSTPLSFVLDRDQLQHSNGLASVAFASVDGGNTARSSACWLTRRNSLVLQNDDECPGCSAAVRPRVLPGCRLITVEMLEPSRTDWKPRGLREFAYIESAAENPGPVRRNEGIYPHLTSEVVAIYRSFAG